MTVEALRCFVAAKAGKTLVGLHDVQQPRLMLYVELDELVDVAARRAEIDELLASIELSRPGGFVRFGIVEYRVRAAVSG